MVPYYDNRRGVYICFVDKAAKDNEVAKKGEPYIWLQAQGRYSPKQLFKNEKEVDKKYPKKYTLSMNSIGKIIKAYNKAVQENSKLKPETFLNTFLK